MQKSSALFVPLESIEFKNEVTRKTNIVLFDYGKK